MSTRKRGGNIAEEREKEKQIFRTELDIALNSEETYTKFVEKTKDTYNRTVLHWIMIYGLSDLLEKWINAPFTEKTDILAKDSSGATPIHDAADSGCSRCIRLLNTTPATELFIKKATLISDVFGNIPLHHAVVYDTCKVGDILCFEELLSINSHKQVNTQNREYKTPLHIAAEKSNITAMKYLLRVGGIDVNIKDKNNQTALDILNTKIQELPDSEDKIYVLRRLTQSSSASSVGGKKKSIKENVIYAGKKYVVRVGSRGGKYILVGMEKKKVYV